MKLNILKWIYDLGYERATDRFYYNLTTRVDNLEVQKNPWVLDELLGIPPIHKQSLSDKEIEGRERGRQQQINVVKSQMREIINEVFHPVEEAIMKEPLDRFGPNVMKG